MAIELTVVSVYWRRWPSFIVQRVAENGAAIVPGDTVVQLYIVVLLGTLWFHFCVACEPVFILLCPVVPCFTGACNVCPVVPCVTLGLVLNPSLLWRHSYKLLH